MKSQKLIHFLLFSRSITHGVLFSFNTGNSLFLLMEIMLSWELQVLESSLRSATLFGGSHFASLGLLHSSDL